VISEATAIIGAVVLAVLLAGTVWATHEFDSGSYSKLEAQFADYRTQSTADHDAALKALNDALSAQIQAREATEKRNEQIAQSLTNVQNDAAAAHRDADFAQRLLAAAKNPGPAAPGPAVSATQGGSGANGPAATLGDRRAGDLPGLTTGAIAECRNAIERLAALQLQLAPQL